MAALDFYCVVELKSEAVNIHFHGRYYKTAFVEKTDRGFKHPPLQEIARTTLLLGHKAAKLMVHRSIRVTQFIMSDSNAVSPDWEE